MPGFVCLQTKSRDAPQRLARMLAATVHEPWYRQERHCFHELDLHLGWTSFADDLTPGLVWNARRDLALLLCGREVTGISAQTLFERFEASPQRSFELLNGTFAGVMVDLVNRYAWFFNDRFGATRVHSHTEADATYFACEAKAVLAVCPSTRAFDPVALAQTVSMGCTLDNRALFQGIQILPPASAWRLDVGGKLLRQRYFDAAAWEAQPALAPEAFSRQLAEVFSRVVPRYVADNGDNALSLTGGLDGRMVLAFANVRQGRLPCFTFGGSVRECHDVRIARELAAAAGQGHTCLPVDETFLQRFGELAAQCVWLSDGAMDVSGAVEVEANRAARTLAPVRITGNYGSEVVRCHVAFRPRPQNAEWLEPGLAPLVEQAIGQYQHERQAHPLSFIAFKQVPWHHHARRAVEQSQLEVRSPFLDNDVVATMYRAPAALRASAEPSMRLIRDTHPALAAIPTDRGYRCTAPGARDRLRAVLRAVSAKAEYAYDYGMPQPLAVVDHLLSRLRLERLFLGHHKFYHFRLWYRRTLAAYVRDTLLAPRALQRSCYRSDVLRRLVEQHTRGRANHTLELHRALTVELTQQQLFDRWSGTTG
jgi:asparagine synthase (glutamine-hydrolysing)